MHEMLWRMRRAALAAVAAMLLCATVTATSKIAVLHSNVLMDGTFNEAIYNGVLEAKASGADFTYSFHHFPNAPTDPDPVVAAIANMAADYGVDHFIIAGFEFAAVLEQIGDVAAWSAGTDTGAYDPYAVRFSLIDTRLAQNFDNLQFVVFQDDDVAFAAGLVAGRVAAERTKRTAVVGGSPYEPVRRLANGFRQGVKHACPTCVIEGEFINTFDPGQLAGLVANYYANEVAADVTFGAAGASGSEVINVTARAGRYVIGVDTDEYHTLFGSGKVPGAANILTSAVKAISVATKSVIYAEVANEFRGGRTWVFDFSNSGVHLSDCHEACAVWDEFAVWEKDQELQLANGVIHTGLDPDGVVRRTYADPNGWVTLPSFSQPPHPRKGHAGPNLGDTWYDRSLYTFFGFTDTGITNQVWAFELQDLSWRRITAADNLVRQFANGTSLQLGGSAQTDAQVLPEPRVYSSGVQLDGGTLVLFGGLSEVSDTGRHAFSDVWTFRKSAPFKGLEFNVLTKMSTLPVEPEGRFQHAATSVGTAMLIFGGRVTSGERVNDVWKHEVTGTHPDNHTWTQLIPVTSSGTAAPLGRSLCTMATFGTRVYVAGGQAVTLTSTRLAADLWAFPLSCLTTPADCVWTQLADMPGARSGHIMVHMYLPPVSDSGAALTGGTGGTDMLVVQGGIDSAGIITDTVFAFNATSGEWATHSSFGGAALMEHTALVYDEQIIIYGGMNASRGLSSEVYAYNFFTENLCALAGLVGCGGHGTCGQGSGVAVCACDVGYDGTACGACASGYFRSDNSRCVKRVVEQEDTSTGVWATLTTLACLEALCYIAMAIMFWRFRFEYAIKASSPEFCIFMCGAGVLASVAGALLAVPVSSFPGMCLMRTWTSVMSGVAILSALFTRTYRLHKIFNNKSLRKIKISNTFLWRVIGLNLGIAATLLGLWSVFDTPSVASTTVEVSAVLHREQQLCSESTLFEFLVALYFMVLILWGCQLAWRTRKLPSVFNESKYVGIAMYASVSTSVIAIPLLFLVREQVDAAAVVRSASTQLSTVMAVGVVLGSKLVRRKAHNAESAAKKAIAAQKRGSATIDAEVVAKLQDEIKRLHAENKHLKVVVERQRLQLLGLRNGAPVDDQPGSADKHASTSAAARTTGGTGSSSRPNGSRAAASGAARKGGKSSGGSHGRGGHARRGSGGAVMELRPLHAEGGGGNLPQPGDHGHDGGGGRAHAGGHGVSEDVINPLMGSVDVP